MVFLSSRHKLRVETLNCPSSYSVFIRPAFSNPEKLELNLWWISAGWWSISPPRARRDTPSSQQGEIFVSDWSSGGGGGLFDSCTCLLDTRWLAFYCVVDGLRSRRAVHRQEGGVLQGDERSTSSRSGNVNIFEAERSRRPAAENCPRDPLSPPQLLFFSTFRISRRQELLLNRRRSQHGIKQDYLPPTWKLNLQADFSIWTSGSSGELQDPRAAKIGANFVSHFSLGKAREPYFYIQSVLQKTASAITEHNGSLFFLKEEKRCSQKCN